MNSNDQAPQNPSQAGDDAATPDTGTPAPAVKRRTRKPAVTPPVEAQAAATPIEATAEVELPAPAKAPRRRKPKVEAEAAVDAPAQLSLPVDASDAAGAAPPAVQLAVRMDEPAPPVASAELSAPLAASDGGEAQDAEQATPSGGVAAGEAGDGDEAGEAGERGRRGRNRRRGRKDRDGAAGDAAAETASGEVQEPREARELRPAPVAVDPEVVTELFAEVLSGAYDAEPPEPDDEASLEQASKRVLRPEPEAPKLHKVLAQSGIGSRRDMEQAIADGQVAVNGETAHIGMRISYGDRITVNGKPVKVRIQGAPARLLAYHKPTGEVVSFNDPEGRPTVFRRLPRLQNGKWQSVGRLDINTEGLLLFTTSGELANQLMHPRFGVEREYAVRVLGSLSEEQRAKLIEGVEVDGQTASFKSIEDGGGEGANRWYRVVITEGRNREVRKLFDSVGMAVSRLIRIRYGTVVLPRGLKRGVWVELGDQDLRAIRQLASGQRGAEPREAREQREGNREERRGARGKPGRGPAQGQQGPREQQQRSAAERPPKREREPRDFEATGSGDEDFTRIPNPLEQTFDRRFAKGSPRRAGQGFGHGGSHIVDPELPPGTIPNPLEQTFDKRFAKGSQRINAGFGRPDSNPGGSAPGQKKGGPKQPDPMQTSVGYIGADAYFNKVGGKRRGGGGGGGQGGGGRGRGGPGGGGGGGGNPGGRRGR